MTDLLSELTLVIPTINRPSYIRRQVLRWRDIPVNLLIIDGSEAPEDLPRVPGCTVKHLRGIASFRERVLAAVACVETPFVALCGDDDIYMEDGLESCIRRLMNDSKMIGCIGSSVRFSFRDHGLFGEPINWEMQSPLAKIPDGQVRLRSIFEEPKLQNQMFGVYRTYAWKKSFGTAFSQQFTTAYVYEFLLLMMMTYQGPIGLSNHLTWLSSAENPSVMQGKGFNRGIGIVEWLTTSVFSTEVTKSKELVTASLAELGQHSYSSLFQTVSECFDILLDRYRFKATRRHRWKPRILLTRLLPYLSPRIKQSIKMRVPQPVRASLGFGAISWSDLPDKLTLNNLNIDLSEFHRVTRVITDFHQSNNHVQNS